jgi:hypothetical protein
MFILRSKIGAFGRHPGHARASPLAPRFDDGSRTDNQWLSGLKFPSRMPIWHDLSDNRIDHQAISNI